MAFYHHKMLLFHVRRTGACCCFHQGFLVVAVALTRSNFSDRAPGCSPEAQGAHVWPVRTEGLGVFNPAHCDTALTHDRSQL